MVRKMAVALVVMASVLPLYFLCVVPWKCNRVGKALDSAVNASRAGSQEAATFLRNNLRATLACRNRMPCDAGLSIAAAATYSLSGEHQEAIAIYGEALRYDRRPEMYFNRAGNRMKIGDERGAYEDYLLAARFNPSLAARIQTPEIRSRVEEELQRLYGDAYP